MATKYIEYPPRVLQGQSALKFNRTRKMLIYKGDNDVASHISRGLPLYETKLQEKRGENENGNLIMRGECISACAYLLENNIQVDLVYIDPPFASGADYAKKVYLRRNPKIAEELAKAETELDNEDMRTFEAKMYGDIWEKEKYLNWMYENLMAIKSVMSPTASIYVHLDYHIGHYVKILLDEVFGESNFRNEIIWFYNNKMSGNTTSHAFVCEHDSIFLYSNSDENIYNTLYEKREESIKQSKRVKVDGKNMRARDENGNIIYEVSEEKKIKDVWQIPYIASTDSQRTGYATQKPEALLERIIKASSDEGMVVADFFGGSGVAAAVAHKTGRRFIHVDINDNSISTARDRLVKEGAEFERLDIMDGVSLFRNPAQTNDMIPKLIKGLMPDHSLSAYWKGVINYSSEGKVPVHLPNLLNGNSDRVFSIASAHKLCYEELSALPHDIKKCIIYYIDIDDMQAIKQYIADNTKEKIIDVEFRDITIILDNIVGFDEAEFSLKEVPDGLLTKWSLEVVSFTSDRVKRKIDEFNDKSAFNGKETHLALSDDGLEAIEWISIDTATDDPEAPWNSDAEIRIETDNRISIDGKKTATFWDGTITHSKKPLRVKIRNICGDESVFSLSEI